MSGLAGLMACKRTWQGTNQLQDPNTGEPEVSPSGLTVTPVLRGSFIRLDYDWVYRGTPQEGSLLLGFQEKEARVTAYWIDTWHMRCEVMVCQGEAEAPDIISVQGLYAAPPGPDWGWRIDIYPEASQSVRLVMHNVSPEGQAYPAVEAEYRQSQQAS